MIYVATSISTYISQTSSFDREQYRKDDYRPADQHEHLRNLNVESNCQPAEVLLAKNKYNLKKGELNGY
jgi:hypothetical protein